MKSLKQLAGITLFGALACVGMQAQTLDLRATIPFDFAVGQATMPAGDYTIHGDGVVISVRQVDGARPANAYVMTINGPSALGHTSPRLEFHRYGDQYFLAAIKGASSGSGREVPQTGREKEVAKRMGTSAEATVLATRK